MNFTRNALGQLFTSAASLVLGFAVSVLLARALGTADRGSFGLALTGAEMAVLFGHLGLGTAAIYRLRRAGVAPAQVATTALAMVVLASVLLLVAAPLLAPWLLRRAPDEFPRSAYVMAAALAPFLLLGLAFSGVCRGLDRFRWQNAYQLATKAGSLLALLLVLVLFERGLTAALAALAAVQALAALGLLARVLRHTGVERRVDLRELSASAAFGAKSWLQTLAGQIHERADILMLAWFLADSAQVAHYVVAVGLVALVQVVPESFATALLPKLAGLEPERAADFAARVARSTVCTTLILVVLLSFAASWLVPLVYGADYQASVRPLLILLPAVVLLSLFRVLARYFIALGRQSVNIAIQALSLVVNLALNVLLIPRHGAAGAAAASLVSYALEALLMAAAFSRRSGIGPLATLLPRRADAADLLLRLRAALFRPKASPADGEGRRP